MNEGSYSFTIDEALQGKRLDRAIQEFFPAKSRSLIQKLIEDGLVTVNDQKALKRSPVRMSDCINIELPPLESQDLLPQPIPLTILYEDAHIIAVEKPQGMVVHPAPGHPDQTLVNALLHHCGSLAEGSDPSRPGIVHRLDKDTSGALLVAKSDEAYQGLIRDFAQQKISKTYLAVCVGTPREGRIDKPLGRHPIKRKEMAIIPEGKPAQTDIELLRSDGRLSFVKARPITGRTHQIRVHLKSLGTPILGDPVYGSRKLNLKHKIEGQLLHSYQLKLNHPITNEPLLIEASFPKWDKLLA